MGGRALVLGGGGIAGIAWEIGMLAGLRAAGIDVTDADTIVGTSAGSVVGSLVTAPAADLDALYQRQLEPLPPPDPATANPAGTAPPFDSDQMFAALAAAVAGASGAEEARARIGAYALANQAAPEVDQRRVMTRVLGADAAWPRQRLLVTAVDAESGEWVAFERGSGVDLVDAVAASTCVPGVWTPPEINGHRYMDGGVRSIVNADLAEGSDRVLILAPLPGMGFRPEVRRLEEAGAKVVVVYADEATKTAMGSNPLDPATRAPSARAGHAQAAGIAAEVRALWTAATTRA